MQRHEDVEKVFGVVGFGFLAHDPLGLAALVSFYLNRNRPRTVGTACDDVDAAAVSQCDRRQIPTYREFGGDKVLACNTHLR